MLGAWPRGGGGLVHTPSRKPEIRLTNRPTYLSQPEIVLRVSKRAEMNGSPREGGYWL